MWARDHVWLFWEWSEDSHLADDFLLRAGRQKLRCKSFHISQIPSLEGLKEKPPLVLWDRAGDIYEAARYLADWAEALGSRVINPPRGMLLARDKGVLHRLLSERALPVPQTQFLSDHSNYEDFRREVGKYLVLKPVRSGGGEGVRIQEWCEGGVMNSFPGQKGQSSL